MIAPEQSVTLRIPRMVLWLLRIGVAALGLGLGFLVKPLVHWILDTVGDAPGPLRAVAALPATWAVVVLTVAGVLAGIWLSHIAEQESLVLTVGPTSVELAQDGLDRHIPRADIAAVFQDRKELVFLDARTKELARRKASDLSMDTVRATIERFDYPWVGTSDPREQEFRRWVDGHPDLDERGNQLLRTRARALTDKQTGTAANLAEDLQSAGLVVRDRDGAQEYRRVPQGS